MFTASCCSAWLAPMCRWTAEWLPSTLHCKRSNQQLKANYSSLAERRHGISTSLPEIHAHATAMPLPCHAVSVPPCRRTAAASRASPSTRPRPTACPGSTCWLTPQRWVGRVVWGGGERWGIVGVRIEGSTRLGLAGDHVGGRLAPACMRREAPARSMVAVMLQFGLGWLVSPLKCCKC